MTSAFDQELYGTNAEFLDTFGSSVFVRGKNYKAIYEEVEIEAESGFRLLSSLMFDRTQCKHFRKGDTVVLNNKEYVLKEIPRDNELDSLITIEVQYVKDQRSI